jgi:DNA polymerase-3 subunit epsilon
MEIEKIINDLNQLNFTAIDVETANEKRASICSIGIVVVENGEIKKRIEHLIKPKELRFRDFNTQIHGLTENQVSNSPEFDEIWEKISNEFSERIVLAHNAEFDLGALRQTLELYKIDFPVLKYACTQKISQYAFQELKNYRLVDVASFLGLKFNHHNSLSDASVAATIGIRGLPLIDKKSYSYWSDELTQSLRKKESEEKKQSYIGFGEKHLESKLLKPDLENADSKNPFYNKKVVFTGDLDSFKRQDAAIIIQKLGADINTSISKKTDIVIMGSGAGPSKLKKITELSDEGYEIEIINEQNFLILIQPYL